MALSSWRVSARGALVAASAGFVVLGLPVVLRGAPLVDDFTNCMEPLQDGLGPTVAVTWERLGVARLARFVEILLTTGVCQSPLPFGVAIAVPLALTVLVAWQLRGLLHDLGVAGPWPETAAVVWLLQPLGTEAALWPAALHVPLGLALALAALRLHHRGLHAWGTVAALGAFMSAEQTVLALPLAAWLLLSGGTRTRATVWLGTVAALVAVVFLTTAGHDPRLAVTMGDRLAALPAAPGFLARFFGLGLGLHSGPVALGWALPWSLLLIAVTGATGWFVAGRPVAGRVRAAVSPAGGLAALAGVLVAANLPVLASLPWQGSPRVFTPTWLILAGAAGLGGARLPWDRLPRRPLGALAGVAAGVAVLSLILSVSVRLASAAFTEDAARLIAPRTQDGDVVAVCGVRRTVVEPAPRGSFASHDFVFTTTAAAAVDYYTGRRVEVRVAGPLWDTTCPETGADLTIDFDNVAP